MKQHGLVEDVESIRGRFGTRPMYGKLIAACDGWELYILPNFNEMWICLKLIRLSPGAKANYNFECCEDRLSNSKDLALLYVDKPNIFIWIKEKLIALYPELIKVQLKSMSVLEMKQK